jgi:hypothetical protein
MHAQIWSVLRPNPPEIEGRYRNLGAARPRSTLGGGMSTVEFKCAASRRAAARAEGLATMFEIARLAQRKSVGVSDRQMGNVGFDRIARRPIRFIHLRS